MMNDQLLLDLTSTFFAGFSRRPNDEKTKSIANGAITAAAFLDSLHKHSVEVRSQASLSWLLYLGTESHV
jgi:hypothetical protein